MRATQDAPAVSVVVPCYNGGRFLDGLMASLAQQTFRDFEVVIVDDGSTDELTAQKLALLKDQARVIHQKNGGASAARNTGTRHVHADIVFMLDCDDTIEPTFLAETVTVLQNAPPNIGMVVSALSVGWRRNRSCDALFQSLRSALHQHSRSRPHAFARKAGA